MKGKVENTIPQRQYENIKTTYYFENEEERKTAIESSISDCITLKDAVSKSMGQMQPPVDKANIALGVTEELVVNDVQLRKRKGYWEYWDKEDKQWKFKEKPNGK